VHSGEEILATPAFKALRRLIHYLRVEAPDCDAAITTRATLRALITESVFYLSASLVQTVVVVPSVIRAFTHASSVPPSVGTMRTSYSPGLSNNP